MAGAAGIGVFIAFVGSKDSGFISAAPYPTLTSLTTEWPYKHGEHGVAHKLFVQYKLATSSTAACGVT